MIEHPLFILSGFSVNDSSIFLQVDSSEMEQFMEEFHNGYGVLTKNTEAQCFYTSSKAKPGWPDTWIAIHPMPSVDGVEILNFYVVVGRPQSKGTIALDANKYRAGVRDDQQLALIDYKLLTNPDDVEALLEGKTILFLSERDSIKFRPSRRCEICLQHRGHRRFQKHQFDLQFYTKYCMSSVCFPIG